MADISFKMDVRGLPEVKAELQRLRALIKTVEWADGTHGEAHCPWCGSYSNVHHASCAAFTPEGEVK